MIFETERLILRPWSEDDAADLYEYAKDPDVGPSVGWPPHTSVENSREIIKTVLSEPETYAVVLKETGKPVGSIGVFEPTCHEDYIDREKCEYEVGYWIGKPFWGRGLIPEAVRELQKHCFETLGASGMWLRYSEGNTKSARVAEKCGFSHHHTEIYVLNPFFKKTETKHFTYISKEKWAVYGD